MALIRLPTLDSRGNGDTGVAPIEAYVDTSTGQILNRVRQGDSENGFTYAYQPTGQTWEFANRAGSNGQMIYGSQGYTAPTFQDQGDGSWNSMGSGGDTANGMHQIGDDPQLMQWLTSHGAAPQYDPNYGYVVSAKDWSTLGPEYRKSIYTGGDPMSDFLGSYGPLLVAGFGAGSILGSGLGGVAGAGDAYLPGALGADGINSGIINAGLGSVAGDAYLPGALPSGVGDAYLPGNMLSGSGAAAGDAYLPGSLANTLSPSDALAATQGAPGGYSSIIQQLQQLAQNTPTSLPGGTQAPAPVQNGPTNPSTGPNGSVPGSAAGSSLSQMLQQLGISPSLANLLAGSSGTSGGLLGAGMSALPSYLAYNYASNLPQPNIGAYTDLYNKAGDTSGLLGTYDLNTGTGRSQLQSSLSSRGVLGSSFGDQALTNYNTQRDLGRGSLGYQGIGTQLNALNGGNTTLLAQNKIKTDLLGRALGGAGNALSTSTTPTGGTNLNDWLTGFKNIFAS